MGKYDWLLEEYNRTYVYNYEKDIQAITGSAVNVENIVKENGREQGVRLSWYYTDKDKDRIFNYTGTAKIRERNLFIYSQRTDEQEEVLTIFPLPFNYRFDVLFGVAVGTSGGFPTAFRVLWSSKRLSIAQAEKEFEQIGASLKNSLISLDYNPDEYVSALAEEEQRTTVEDDLVSLEEIVYKSREQVGEKKNPGKYDWLQEYKNSYEYNYERIPKKLTRHPIRYEGVLEEKGTKVGINVSWAYREGKRVFEYSGVAQIRERNFYVYSQRMDGHEDVLTIYPLPFDFRFDVLFGVVVGTSGGFPTAFRVMWSNRRLSLAQAEREFERIGATVENSLITMNYNSDEYISVAEEEEQEPLDKNLIRLNYLINKTGILNELEEK